MLDFSYNLDSVFSHELCKSAFSDGIFWDSGVEPHLGSMQHAFVVSLLCFAYVGFYFWGELRNKQRTSAATLANNES